MQAQPAASALPNLRAGETAGKFQGVSAATTPIGSWKVRYRVPGGAGIVRP